MNCARREIIKTLSSIAGVVALAAAGGLLGGGAGVAATSDPQVTVTSAEGPAGGEVTVAIEGESGESPIGAFTIDLVYDPNVAVARECTTSLGLCEPQINDSTARVTGVSLGGLSGHIEFVAVTFDIVGEVGAATVLDVRVVELADLGSNDLAAQTEIIDGEISVSSGLTGDADCNGGIDSVDALAILRDVAGSREAGCGDAADVDCDGELTSADALRVLRHVASLPVNAPPDCPPIGG